jgi:hypothetical protein
MADEGAAISPTLIKGTEKLSGDDSLIFAILHPFHLVSGKYSEVKLSNFKGKFPLANEKMLGFIGRKKTGFPNQYNITPSPYKEGEAPNIKERNEKLLQAFVGYCFLFDDIQNYDGDFLFKLAEDTIKGFNVNKVDGVKERIESSMKETIFSNLQLLPNIIYDDVHELKANAELYESDLKLALHVIFTDYLANCTNLELASTYHTLQFEDIINLLQRHAQLVFKNIFTEVEISNVSTIYARTPANNKNQILLLTQIEEKYFNVKKSMENLESLGTGSESKLKEDADNLTKKILLLYSDVSNLHEKSNEIIESINAIVQEDAPLRATMEKVTKSLQKSGEMDSFLKHCASTTEKQNLSLQTLNTNISSSMDSLREEISNIETEFQKLTAPPNDPFFSRARIDKFTDEVEKNVKTLNAYNNTLSEKLSSIQTESEEKMNYLKDLKQQINASQTNFAETLLANGKISLAVKNIEPQMKNFTTQQITNITDSTRILQFTERMKELSESRGKLEAELMQLKQDINDDSISSGANLDDLSKKKDEFLTKMTDLCTQITFFVARKRGMDVEAARQKAEEEEAARLKAEAEAEAARQNAEAEAEAARQKAEEEEAARLKAEKEAAAEAALQEAEAAAEKEVTALVQQSEHRQKQLQVTVRDKITNDGFPAQRCLVMGVDKGDTSIEDSFKNAMIEFQRGVKCTMSTEQAAQFLLGYYFTEDKFCGITKVKQSNLFDKKHHLVYFGTSQGTYSLLSQMKTFWENLLKKHKFYDKPTIMIVFKGDRDYNDNEIASIEEYFGEREPPHQEEDGSPSGGFAKKITTYCKVTKYNTNGNNDLQNIFLKNVIEVRLQFDSDYNMTSTDLDVMDARTNYFAKLFPYPSVQERELVTKKILMISHIMSKTINEDMLKAYEDTDRKINSVSTDNTDKEAMNSISALKAIHFEFPTRRFILSLKNFIGFEDNNSTDDLQYIVENLCSTVIEMRKYAEKNTETDILSAYKFVFLHGKNPDEYKEEILNTVNKEEKIAFWVEKMIIKNDVFYYVLYCSFKTEESGIKIYTFCPYKNFVDDNLSYFPNIFGEHSKLKPTTTDLNYTEFNKEADEAELKQRFKDSIFLVPFMLDKWLEDMSDLWSTKSRFVSVQFDGAFYILLHESQKFFEIGLAHFSDYFVRKAVLFNIYGWMANDFEESLLDETTRQVNRIFKQFI